MMYLLYGMSPPVGEDNNGNAEERIKQVRMIIATRVII
jgi:hypothetical protein